MTLRVLATGPLTTFQDGGRPGQAASGIGRSGACDRVSFALANRMVGNPAGTAVLEVTLGGLRLLAQADVVLATTGARCAGGFPHQAATTLRAGEQLQLGRPDSGLRTYVAVRGGFYVEPVLGSGSTDVLGGLGPAALSVGDELVVGGAQLSAAEGRPAAEPVAGVLHVDVLPGPRRDWFADGAWGQLLASPYTVSMHSNRVGLRLEGPLLDRVRTEELPSEPMMRGAIQVPPSGQPVLFLADHPVTGGYPVLAYVVDEDVDRCGQLRPGQALRFRAAQSMLLR